MIRVDYNDILNWINNNYTDAELNSCSNRELQCRCVEAFEGVLEDYFKSFEYRSAKYVR